MENRVYICSWDHVGDRYQTWVRDRLSVRAEGASFEQADIALADAICGAFGDGEGVREYDRPHPGATDVPGLVTVVASVTGNGLATVENLEELYAGPQCPRCRIDRGTRTAVPLRLSGIDGSADGGTGLQSGIRFFSEAFLNRLTPAERDACEWRRIERKGRTKKVYYELAGSRIHVPTVALSPLVEDLWHVSLARAQGHFNAIRHCELCGWESSPSYLFMPRGLPRAYIDFAALSESIPACFTDGRPDRFHFCLPLARWRALLGTPGTRGIASFEIGVVASSLVDPNPRRERIPANTDREG